MRIGNVEIQSRLALAPMAGVTDVAFRQICAELGAGLTCTELVSSRALCYHDKKTFSLLRQFQGEHPAAVQIFGNDPVCMAEAAQIAMEHTGADILDINMGCPMGKIVNNGDGAALMRDPDKAGRIVEAVVKAMPRSPKRQLRDVKKRLEHRGTGTRSQQALKMQQEQGKAERKARTRAQKEAEEQLRFAMKQQKRKEKHKGH